MTLFGAPSEEWTNYFKKRKLLVVVVVVSAVVAGVYYTVGTSPSGWSTPSTFFNVKVFLNDSKFPRPATLPCDWYPETITANRTTRRQCFLLCHAHADAHADADDVERERERETAIKTSSSSYNNYYEGGGRWSPTVVCRDVEEKRPVTSISEEALPCLKAFIRGHCYGQGHPVPRLAHYVRFGAYTPRLAAFISIYSVARFLQPCLILLHGDVVPTGPYWNAILQLVPNIVHVETVKPTEIFGHKFKYIQHSSDITRLQALLEYGGVYLDFDEILLNPLEPLLRRKETSVGNQEQRVLGNALIVAPSQAPFLKLWLRSYRQFDPNNFNSHCCYVPTKLAENHTDLVRRENTFFEPTPRPNKKLALYDTARNRSLKWRHRYAIHLYLRMIGDCFNGSRARIDHQDNGMGDILRYILHGVGHNCTGPEDRQKVPLCFDIEAVRRKLARGKERKKKKKEATERH